MKYVKNGLRACFILCLASGPWHVYAGGMVLSDNQLRSDLTWLNNNNIIAINLSTWPLSQDDIAWALARAKHSDNLMTGQVISRVNYRLSEIKSPVRVKTWAQSTQSALPPGFSDSRASAHGVSAALEMSGEAWGINLQGQQEHHQYINDVTHGNLNGAYAGINLFNQWIAFGEIPQWWGPGNDGSLIRSDAARPVVGFLMQRAEQSPFDTPWLAWLGSWQYQLSAGQLRQYHSPEEAKLMGARVTFTPVASLETGFSRMMMWGGKGRPNHLASFRDAFLGRDNTGSQDRDPGNQMAGFDVKWKLFSLTGLPIAFYGQAIGDDQAGILPSHNAFLAGFQGNHSWGNQQVNWYVEGADTRAGMKTTGNTYYHYCYHEGYYQQGASLGDAMGGDGTRYSVKTDVVLENEQRLSARLMWARVNRDSLRINKAYPQADTLKGAELGWSVPVSPRVTVGSAVWFTDRDSASHDTGIAVKLSFFSGEVR